jgi:hypothetical protein
VIDNREIPHYFTFKAFMMWDRRNYMMHTYKCVFLLIFFFATGNAQPVLFETPPSPRIANYDIDVRLQPESNSLQAKQTLYWKNTSREDVKELRFHMYLNGFRNNQSTFLQYSRKSRDKEEWGYIKIDSLWDTKALVLPDQMEYIQPDDDNKHDKTVLSVPLRRALRPGEKLTLNFIFSSKLPEPPIARTGASDDFYMVGQWFPKIGVLQNGEWNCHQFHRNSEFFADFGVYNVRITVPEEWIVGATGILVNKMTNEESTVTHYYHAEDVHDFAWTASPDFVEFAAKADDVEIRVLMAPEHSGQGERFIKAAHIAVQTFQEWYGDYPYPNLTVVDPKPNAMRAGGMEYPTLITAMTLYGLPRGIKFVEQVIIHEFGHNYWYGMVASNEFEESWIDEGINSYAEARIMREHYGEFTSFIDLCSIHIGETDYHRSSYLRYKDYDSTVRKAWEYYSGSSYTINSYSKPVVFLTTLENYLGDEVMRQILRTFFQEYKFKHPVTKDFINVANRISGQDLNRFFEQALFTNHVLDYSVSYLSSRKVKNSYGYDFNYKIGSDSLAEKSSDAVMPDSSARSKRETLHFTIESDVTLKVDSTISMQGVSLDTVKSTDEDTTFYHSVIKVRRLGDFIFPVELELVFTDDDTIREQWDGKDLWKEYEYIKPQQLISATVDPDRKIILDVNITNNSKMRQERKLGPRKIGARLLFWMQNILELPALLHF